MPKKKKTRKTKKVKTQKKTKISKIKTQPKLKPGILDKKTTNFGPDEKPEIKKIKKQPTEKRVYNLTTEWTNIKGVDTYSKTLAAIRANGKIPLLNIDANKFSKF